MDGSADSKMGICESRHSGLKKVKGERSAAVLKPTAASRRRNVHMRTMSATSDIVWKEIPIKLLDDVWCQHAIKVWNNFAAAPAAILHRRNALAPCHAAFSRSVCNCMQLVMVTPEGCA